jgi:hypothetical protein
MQIKIKIEKDEVIALIQQRLKELFPSQTFWVHPEYYGSYHWEADSIQPEDDDANKLTVAIADAMAYVEKEQGTATSKESASV